MVFPFAMYVAGVPPSRILIFGQSIGTEVDIVVSKHFALQPLPVVFAAVILVVPFIDMTTLVSTYRVKGIVPLLSPLDRF